ncbi:MAG: hypothetical protein U5Q44_02695 [Dehalococcoidia bacterium]|nr:hypothetical protein [Dehalococcoidia bacterium]
MYEKVREAMSREEMAAMGFGNATYGIGTPDELREHLRKFQDAGMDQTVFIQQGGKNRRRACRSAGLLPRASRCRSSRKVREAERLRKKDEELAPYIEAAFKRKAYMPELADEDIPAYRRMRST